MNELPTTADEARSLGMKIYFNGKPCAHGHISTRRTANNVCTICHRARANLNTETKRAWNEANRDYFRDKARARRAKNPEATRAQAREYMREKYKRPEQKMRVFLGGCIRSIMTGKGRRTSESLVGYSFTDLRNHLEKQFLKGMSWSNYGDWHIDHITPISYFISQGISDPAVVNALPNLRPMWAKDNISKGAKIEVLL